MPFIQALGYDTSEPLEVVPEYTTDVGTKKGEKIDYVIFKNDTPAILIECKACNNELNVQNEGQLLRYFHVSKASFGILTNGVIYKFYSDLEEKNIMDTKPFLIIDLLDQENINFEELEKFRKEVFEEENIRKTADLLKTSKEVKDALLHELIDPSQDFVKVIFTHCGGTRFTDKASEKYKKIVKSELDIIIKEKVKASIEDAFNSAKKEHDQSVEASKIEEPEIITTQEEIEGLMIIRAIASEYCSVESVIMRDAKSYCAILFDNNNRKPIVRLYFNNKLKLMLGLFHEENETKENIESISDIYKFKRQIIETLEKHMKQN